MLSEPDSAPGSETKRLVSQFLLRRTSSDGPSNSAFTKLKIDVLSAVTFAIAAQTVVPNVPDCQRHTADNSSSSLNDLTEKRVPE